MTPRFSPTLATAVVAVASLFALSACNKESASTSQQTATQPIAGGTLTWGVGTEPTCFDPHSSSQQNSFFLIRNFVDSLVAKLADGSFVPWLAKSWTVSEDGKTYNFILRDDVKFTDGTPFNADAVKANFDYIINNKGTTSASASLLVPYDHIEVLSPSELKIVLKQPDSTTLESLSSVKLGFLSPKTLAENKDLCAGGPALVGTGPFTFASYQRGQSVTFAKNPDYHWGPAFAQHQGPAYLDQVVYRFLPEASVRTGALSSGQVDLIEGVQPTDIGVFDKVDGFQYLTGPSATTSFSLNINYTTAPADDVRVRRALRDGFDLDAIVKSVYLGTVRRAWSNIGPDNADHAAALNGSWGNKVEQANKLLDEAGWTQRDADGFRTRDGKRLSIEVGYPQPYVRDSRDVLIRAIQSALRQNIGLDLHLQITTAGDFANQKATGNWTIYPNTDNPSDVAMELWDMLGDKGFLYNAIAKSDPVITGDINQARLLPVGPQRRELLAKIQQYAVDQAYIVPLFAPAYHVAAKSTVHGVGFEPQLDSPASSYDLWTTPASK
ncbi:peptide/nickel transport system substrate-binding protein [Herbaspirillum sp. Sphag1AN]|uniref:ABC transporter substrate-binding protein n=1 Tax=unclassified Herbaspirillum TaxID=2624150 RepID=UPI001621D603|nr:MULTISPECIES: ABC transporter substrate-binding protein [unclassified Herbaspirillum]MBB3213810.1 peptide/nickel transport system substrate-binding protein [Herbaspirillum sp. Sphag1AN]MBB3247007.1 peptide/nickel transport system substrate-binding protein [Herbaspirillum sp. Sphag64]